MLLATVYLFFKNRNLWEYRVDNKWKVLLEKWVFVGS